MLKRKSLARIGNRIGPSIWLSKSFLGHVFDFHVQLVNDILNGTTKWSTILESGAQLVAQMGER